MNQELWDYIFEGEIAYEQQTEVCEDVESYTKHFVDVAMQMFDEEDGNAASRMRDDSENMAARMLLRVGLLRMFATESSPALVAAIARLRDGGMSRIEAMFEADHISLQVHLGLDHPLTEFVPREVSDADDNEAEDNESNEEFRERSTQLLEIGFDALPLPATGTFIEAVIRIAQEKQIATIDEILHEVMQQLEVDHLPEELLSRYSPHMLRHALDFYRGFDITIEDKAYYTADIFLNIAFLHRLSQYEIERAVLMPSVDMPNISSPINTCYITNTTDELPVAHHINDGRLLIVDLGDGAFDGFAPGDMIAVQLSRSKDEDSAIDINITPVSSVSLPGNQDSALVATTLRNIYNRLAPLADGLPVALQDIWLVLITEFTVIFSQASLPMRELLTQSGLETDGDYVAHEEQQWDAKRLSDTTSRLLEYMDEDDEARELSSSFAAIADATADQPAPAEDYLRFVDFVDEDPDFYQEAIDILSELFSGYREGIQAFPQHLVNAARTHRQKATANLLAAVFAQGFGYYKESIPYLENAVRLDRHSREAALQLAWYAADCGDFGRAQRLWNTIDYDVLHNIDRFGVIEHLYDEPTADVVPLRRNDPCWCGSGRKFKQCHSGKPAEVPLEDRVHKLWYKAALYVEMYPPTSNMLYELMSDQIARSGEPEKPRPLPSNMLWIDLILCEYREFREFVESRSDFLPIDEVVLGESWGDAKRSVFEIESIERGWGLQLRDIRTEERYSVRDRELEQNFFAGMHLCGRVVSDGTQYQLLPGFFVVPAERESELLEVLNEEDVHVFLDWLQNMSVTPRLMTREHEPMVACDVVLQLGDTPAASVRSFLDATYANEDAPKEIDADGNELWRELHDIGNDELVLRAAITLSGDTVHVHTTSVARIERVLDAIRAEFPGLSVVSDERLAIETPEQLQEHKLAMFSSPSIAGGSGTSREIGGFGGGFGGGPLGTGAVPDDVREQITQQMEKRWISEPVPALGGLTPIQAADDPTRRGQLKRLIRSFDDVAVPENAMTLRPAELRRLLGL